MTGYNDPKTTKPATRGGSGRTIWIIGLAILLLLALAWFFGLFGRGGDVDTTTTGDVGVEDTAPATTTTGTEPVITDDATLPADDATTTTTTDTATTPAIDVADTTPAIDDADAIPAIDDADDTAVDGEVDAPPAPPAN